MTAQDILDALIAAYGNTIWATELSFFNGKRRIDFWTLHPHPSKKFLATAYEIKISRSDFVKDGAAKQAGALKYSDQFYYVTSPGLVKKEELPDWAGLQEWNGERFRTILRAPLRTKADPDWAFIVALLRSCGDCQRDYGMLKMQLDAANNRVARFERQQRLRNQMQLARLMDNQNA